MAEQSGKLEHMVEQFDGEWCDIMDELIKKIRAQAEEIRLLRQCNTTDRELEIIKLKEEIAKLRARGVTEREVRGWLRDASPQFTREVIDEIRQQGNLIEDAPKPGYIEHWRDGGKVCDIEQITEDDPLKVAEQWMIEHPGPKEFLATKFNALVDEVRNRLANLELTLEREPNFYNAYAESIEDHSERIALLEHQLRAHLGKEALS